MQSSTQIREFSVHEMGGAPGAGGTLGSIGLGANHSDNGLGISADGRYAYTVTNSSTNKTLAKHDRATNQTSTTTFSLNSPVLRGAVQPTTGIYYFASNTVNNGITLYAWNEAAVPQTYVQVGTLRPTSTSNAFGGNGDMAFSASGQLVLVADNFIYSADIPDGLVSSSATIDAKQVHNMGQGVLGNGIAFGNLGHIFVSTSSGGNRIVEVDLARGQTINSTSLGAFSPTDMSSCTFPNTLTLKKAVPGGRAAATDQFGLRVESPAGYQVPQTTATTTTSATGVQPDYAGPIFTNQGDSFSLSESASGTTDLGHYASSLACEQLNSDGSTTPLPVSASNSVIQPSGARGTDVTCVFTNDLLVPDLALRKTSNPGSGVAVSAGQTIAYTVVAENTGNTVLDPVTIADNLAGVFDHALYQGDVTTSIDGSPVTSGAAVITGTTLEWSGTLQPGQSVTIDYSVVVRNGAEGERIANSVTASATPPAPFNPITPPVVSTESPVAGFTLTKSANPGTGTVVEPGQVISYTVTGTNTGSTPLNPAVISDDLTQVLEHSDYNGDIMTVVDGIEIVQGAATISGNDLEWSGALQSGKAVTVTYSVTVKTGTSGKVLRNVATGSATPTSPNPSDPTGPPLSGDPIDPPPVATEHPVIGSGFTVSKSADPASGTAVEAGDTIKYTIVGTNTGDTALNPTQIVDDLSAVLSHSTYNDDVSVDRGAAAVASQTLSWGGTIPQGGSVTITYSVTVNDGVTSALLNNVARGLGVPMVPLDPSDPDSPTVPGTSITPPPAVTTHPVVDTGFTINKTSSPGSGSAVRSGDVIEYTITAANTGNTVLDPASVRDDLSTLLANVDYNNDAVATSGSIGVAGNVLGWTGILQPGDVATITYSVTVKVDATRVLLRNTVEGAATPLVPADPTVPNSPTTPGTPLSPPPVTTEHPVVNPGFVVTKSANPVTGTPIDPGTVIRYTVIGTNTGDSVLDPAQIVDNLAAVLANAVFNDDIAATRGFPALSNDVLTWSGALNPGQNVTITYSVTVNPDAGGEIITNTVTGEATPLMPDDPSDPGSPTTPGTPMLPPAVTTNHPVNAPGFTFAKTVDPGSGTAIDPGDVLTYTLTGTNTGETTLDPVGIVDDLSKVLDFATYNGDGFATISGTTAALPVITGGELTWTGALGIGERVTVNYSVTVRGDAAGKVLENSATATATPPGGGNLTPPPGTTRNPVNQPGFSVSKSGGIQSGTAVDPGSIITYTVTGTNTGQTALDPVSISDDMSRVLDNARYNGDASAVVDGTAAAEPSITTDRLSWAGALQVGESVTITYSVTVNANAGGAALANSVAGSATPPGGIPPIDTPPADTRHPVNTPGFSLLKAADPASGTRVDPGAIISYTVVGENTGETVLDLVTISDDLVGVLSLAAYNNDAIASSNRGIVVPLTVENEKLLWSGSLGIGDRITITYSVRVDSDAGGDTIRNVATGVAVPPGGLELVPPPATTEHLVGLPGFTFMKTSDPGSGASVAPGSVVNYTLTGVNTGETNLDQVDIADNLGPVLRYAKFNDDVTIHVGGQEVTPVSLVDSELYWTGGLKVGETVTVSYSVTISAALGATVTNIALASATAPGGKTITVPARKTEHMVVEALAYTGGYVALWGVGAGALLILGGGGVLIARRNSRKA